MDSLERQRDGHDPRPALPGAHPGPARELMTARRPDLPHRVLVTGASGKLGTVACRRLAAAGVSVVAFDRTAPASPVPAGVTSIAGDLTDAAAVRRAVTGCDALIHLATHAGPENPDTFSVNTTATYNVLANSAAAGIRRAAIASSVCAYGFTFAIRPFSPRYAPVDEDHPLAPQDAYGLAKVVDEATARAFVDAYGMSVVALRFHWLAAPEEVAAAAARLTPLPTSETSRDLWCYTELADAARACELALGVSHGFHAVNICAADSLSDVPTRDLLARFHPATEIRHPLEGTASAWSTARARDVLGFVPQYSWRNNTSLVTERLSS